jgi:hypothetical protein
LSIYPDTDLGDPTLKAPYTAGSAITASDLTNNQLQVMRKQMEFKENKVGVTGDTMTGDLTLGEDAKIIFEGATDNAHETTLTVTDPTADRTITLPNVTGTVVTTGDTNTVTSTMITDGTIVNADVNASAAIAGTKISPDFGSQTVTTTGNLTVGSTSTLADVTGGAVITSGTSTSDTKVYSAKRTGEIFYGKDTAEEIQSGETWSSADTKVATTAAIDARIIDLVDDVGGFVAIANETSFPTANPDVNNGTGTIVSVKAASTTLTPSGTTVTIANGAGTGNTVTITGVPSAIGSGFGFLVETTTTLHTYTFHRLSPKATEVTTVAGVSSNVTTVAGIASNVTTVANNNANVSTVAGSITNVNNVGGSIASVNSAAANLSSINTYGDQYQVASSNPSTDGGGNALAEGDLYFNTTADELKVYDGSGWVSGVTQTGNFALTTGNSFSGDNTYVDNAKARFGTGQDLEIFHNTSDSIINDTGTGNLKVQTGGNTKLEIQSGGVDVTGNITVSGTVDGVDLQTLNTAVSANTSKVTNATHTGDVTGATSLTIANDAVTSAKIAADAVTTAKIANDAVTNDKIGADAIDHTEIADNAVRSEHIVANAVTALEIANTTIIDGNIADDTISEAKLDIHAAPSGTDKFLKYTSNGMEWVVPSYTTNTTLTLVDEDDMSSDSASSVPSQQSVKAYADTKLALAGGTITGALVLDDSVGATITTANSSSNTTTLDLGASVHHSITLGENTTFADPSNEVAGQSGSIIITQDGTGSRTAAWNSAWKWTGGTAPTLSTAANAIDRIDYLVVAAGNIQAVASLDVK